LSSACSFSHPSLADLYRSKVEELAAALLLVKHFDQQIERRGEADALYDLVPRR
jgi:hypothetical protein